jgi:hypothetical protein
MKKPLIPFSWMPGSWGLRGKTREIAKAEYELSGPELEEAILRINLDQDPTKLALGILDMQKKNGQISEYEYDISKIKISNGEGKDRDLAILDADLSHGKIDQLAYDRKKADVLGEPWVSMPKIHWNPIGKNRAYFEIDYNAHFIEQLRKNGYDGEESDIINQWMNDVCIGILEEINDMDVEFITPTRRGGALEE